MRDGHEVTLIDSLIPQYGGNLFNIEDLTEKVVVNISDLRDPYSIRELLRGKDVIFNLAGQTSHADSMTDPYTDLDINSRSQLCLLEAVRDICPEAKVVYASTRQIYGKPKYLPVDEDHPIRPVDINGVNKNAGEQFHSLYHDIYGIRTCSLRLTNTFGPGMRIKDARQTFLGIWLRLLIEKKPIRIFGTGKQLRDFNYVDDVVEAMLSALEAPSCWGKALNLGGHEVVSLNQLAQKLVSLHPGSELELVEFPPGRKAIDIGDYYGDFNNAKSSLNWCPRVSLDDGLRRSIEYYQQNLQHYI